MIIFYGLLIAHLIADFMQPASLVRWSKQHWTGLVLHSLGYVVLSALVILGAPFFIVWLLILGLSHYAVDRIKYFIGPKIPGWELIIFLVDQLIHIVIIAGVSWYLLISSGSTLTFFEQYVKNYAVALPYVVAYIIATFSVSILVFEVDRTVCTWTGKTKCATVITFKDRLIGMLERALAVTFVLINPLFFLFPFAFSYSFFRVLRDKECVEVNWTDLSVSISCALVIALLLRFS